MFGYRTSGFCLSRAAIPSHQRYRSRQCRSPCRSELVVPFLLGVAATVAECLDHESVHHGCDQYGTSAIPRPEGPRKLRDVGGVPLRGTLTLNSPAFQFTSLDRRSLPQPDACHRHHLDARLGTGPCSEPSGHGDVVADGATCGGGDRSPLLTPADGPSLGLTHHGYPEQWAHPPTMRHPIGRSEWRAGSGLRSAEKVVGNPRPRPAIWPADSAPEAITSASGESWRSRPL